MSILEINVSSGEVIERAPTESEIAQKNKDVETLANEEKVKADKANARKTLLERLGITEDEAKLLLS